MSTKERMVLALFPNALGIGYAVFDTPKQLLHSRLIRVRPMCSKKCMNVIYKLINETVPDIVVLEDPFGKCSRKRKRITKLIQDVVVYCKQNDIQVYQYSRGHIRQVFADFGQTTKYGIAVTIAKWIPRLQPLLPRPWVLGHTEQHHQGMFDAISLGLTHYYLK